MDKHAALNPELVKRLLSFSTAAKGLGTAAKGKALAGGKTALRFAQGVGGGLSNVATDLLDKGVSPALKGSVGAMRPQNITRTAEGIGHMVGRAAPTVAPAGMTLTAITQGLLNKEGEDQREVVLMLEGFVEKCAEAGVDPEEMWKVAMDFGNIGNYLGSGSSVPMAPERQGLSSTFTNLRRRFGAMGARIWHGDQGVKDYHAKAQLEDAEKAYGHRALQEQLQGQKEMLSYSKYNPLTRKMETDPGRVEAMRRDRMTPYWQERAKTRQARYGAAATGTGRDYGRGGGYTPYAY